MSDLIDDMVDRLLREDAPDAVADEGFCADLMQNLPQHRPRARWPLAAGTMAGAAGCWLSLQSSGLALTGWQDWLSGNLTASALVLLAAVAGLGLLTLVWTITETQDQAF